MRCLAQIPHHVGTSFVEKLMLTLFEIWYLKFHLTSLQNLFEKLSKVIDNLLFSEYNKIKFIL